MMVDRFINVLPEISGVLPIMAEADTTAMEADEAVFGTGV